MTRYAKLGGRKPQYSKSTAELAEEGQASHKEAAASTSAVEKVATEDVGNIEVGKAEGESEGAALEPSKLFKRVKLLKLKAKKATTSERRAAIQAQIRTLEKQVHEVNGKRGVKGIERVSEKGKAADSAVTVDGRERTEASRGITNPWKAMEAERRAKSDVRSAVRREKRAEQRELAVRCYACRQMGHSARDCPESQANVEKGELPIEATVVCCYRCGSTQHTLAKCRKPAPTTGSDLPFAHCFLCQKRGHLASKCEKNGGRGIYPLGGQCMLCRSVEHLAKDCPLNEAQRSGGSSAASTAAIGWIEDLGDKRNGAGADEDDFHAMSRKRNHLDQQAKPDTKRARHEGQQHSRMKDSKSQQKVVSF